MAGSMAGIESGFVTGEINAPAAANEADTAEGIKAVMTDGNRVEGGEAAVEPLLETFDYRGIALDGGFMKDTYDEVGSSYLAVSEDGLLKGFRERAGLPAPGEHLGSFYPDGLYNMFGQIISGFARYYAGTGDPAYKEKVERLVHEWGLTIDEDGFFFNNPSGKTSSYVYDKLVCGLTDAYVYAGIEESLHLLDRITDWAEGRLPRNRHPLNYTIEWYVLSENLYRAYLVTGEKRYYDFGKVWHYWEYWDMFAQNLNIFDPAPWEDEWEGKPDHFHAYSHVNTLNSAAMAYVVTGEEKYLATIRNAYDFLMNEQVFATGGYGPNERLLPVDEYILSLVNSLSDRGTYKHFETQCGSWAAFKLSKYLITLTGEAKYGDWVELLIYNGIGASLPTRADGAVMYSSDYFLGGGTKRYAHDPWTCCTGTRVQAIADYVDLIYFHDDSNIYVNLFTPSSLEFEIDGMNVSLIQRTAFPEKDTIEFEINTGKEAEFGLRFRKPGWLAGPATARVNGKEVELRLLDSGWLAIDREWRDGDQVSVTLPMKLLVSSLSRKRFFPAVVKYGPVVLAIGEVVSNPADMIDFDNLDETFIPIPGEPLHFKVNPAIGGDDEAAAASEDDDYEDDIELIARPFYEFGEWERYFIYFDPGWSDRIEPH